MAATSPCPRNRYATQRAAVLDLGRCVSTKDRIAHLRETKNGKARTVPLSRHARRALRELKEQTQARRNEMEKKVPLDQMPVIPATANGVKMAWQRCRKRAGLPDLRFHDLRHEATSRLFEKGFTNENVS